MVVVVFWTQRIALRGPEVVLMGTESVLERNAAKKSLATPYPLWLILHGISAFVCVPTKMWSSMRCSTMCWFGWGQTGSCRASIILFSILISKIVNWIPLFHLGSISQKYFIIVSGNELIPRLKRKRRDKANEKLKAMMNWKINTVCPLIIPQHV